MAKTLKEYLEIHPPLKTWVVVGKGPSINLWNTVQYDNIINVNEAYVYTRTGLVTRYDDPREFNFCHPSTLGEVIPFMPGRNAGKYKDGYYYEYSEIGLGGASCTGVLAVCLASTLGAENIWMCGFDAIENGSMEYEPSVMNPNNRKRQLANQVPQWQGVPFEIKLKCKFIDSGRGLRDVIDERVNKMGNNLSM